MSKLTWINNTLNLWSNSHTDSVGFCSISFNLVIQFDSDFRFSNSLINATLISANVLIWLLEYFIYHVNSLSHNVIKSYAFFLFSSLICVVVHTTWHKNQNYSWSSNLVPLKTSSLISSTIFLLGGGGGRVRGGGWVVCVVGGEGWRGEPKHPH